MQNRAWSRLYIGQSNYTGAFYKASHTIALTHCGFQLLFKPRLTSVLAIISKVW